jgi:hypothetical protein
MASLFFDERLITLHNTYLDNPHYFPLNLENKVASMSLLKKTDPRGNWVHEERPEGFRDVVVITKALQ